MTTHGTKYDSYVFYQCNNLEVYDVRITLWFFVCN